MFQLYGSYRSIGLSQYPCASELMVQEKIVSAADFANSLWRNSLSYGSQLLLCAELHRRIQGVYGGARAAFSVGIFPSELCSREKSILNWLNQKRLLLARASAKVLPKDGDLLASTCVQLCSGTVLYPNRRLIALKV